MRTGKVVGADYKINDFKKFSKFISDKFDLLVIQDDTSTPSFQPIIQTLINEKKSFEKIENSKNLLTARSLLIKILNKDYLKTKSLQLERKCKIVLLHLMTMCVIKV